MELIAYQQEMRDPLLAGERAHALAVDTGAGWSARQAAALAAAIGARLARQRLRP